MKKLLCGYLLAFVISFMLYIFEPITMYATNMNDFWFDLNTIIDILINNFVMFFTLICIIFTLVYILSKYVFKKINIYNVFFLIIFIIFLATYIVGNFLSGYLPALDGRIIDWSRYTKITVVNGAIWLVIIALTIGLGIKFKLNKTVGIATFISFAVLIMLGSSFVSTLMTPNLDKKKETTNVVTTQNYNMASSDKNFFIFLVDAVDSVMFEEVLLNDEEYKDTFSDFTYFKDTMSAYPYTRDSIPFILSGVWNENETEFSKYYVNAVEKSLLFKELKDKNYDTNIYEEEFPTTELKAVQASNILPSGGDIDQKKYMYEQHRYLLFKFLPFGLKQFADIEKLDFKTSRIKGARYPLFSWENEFNYDLIKNNKIDLTDQKYFSFIHTRGAHMPYNFDRDLKPTDNGNYTKNLEGTLNLINTFINRLKEYNVYDNSVIIVMADHGYNFEEIDGRQNPILFIKGVSEHHDMITSDIPLSYTDLNDAYKDLLKGKTSKELFSNIDKKRERRYIWYRFTHEEYMVEYIQKGKAWNEKTMVRTGKVFKL